MSSTRDESRMELAPAAPAFGGPPRDGRPHMPEPPPVRLTAVDDVQAIAISGLDQALNDFYVSMLQFDRDDADKLLITYKAENVRLLIRVIDPPIERPDMRPIAVEVLSLADAEAKIIGREIEYQRIRGLTAGADALMLQDPAGNWVSISERRGVR